MKKISVFIFFCLITFSICFNFLNVKNIVRAENVFDELKSKEVYLADADSGTVIYKKNSLEKAPIASMCKIMTLNLIFEEIEKKSFCLDDEIVISENASGMGGSQIFLETNGKYKIGELVKGIVVASANDACVALAEKICGSEDAFVSKMNLKAKELKMDSTCFVNCTGLPKVGQYSCAEDVFKMFKELTTHKDYFKYSKIWLDEISHPKDRKTQISNTNKLIRFYNGCDCGKTGYTLEAGSCVTVSAKRDDMRLICVIISAPDSNTRFKEASNLFNYGFANFTSKVIVDNSSPLNIPVSIESGKKDNIEVIAENKVSVFSPKNEQKSYEINFTPNSILKAPIRKGDVIGKLCIYEKGVEIKTVNVVANEDVDEKTYLDRVYDVINNWSIAK